MAERGIGMKSATQNCPAEWSYRSGKTYRDPFQEVQLDVVVTDPNGEERMASGR
jgi:hypothetical protein